MRLQMWRQRRPLTPPVRQQWQPLPLQLLLQWPLMRLHPPLHHCWRVHELALVLVHLQASLLHVSSCQRRKRRRELGASPENQAAAQRRRHACVLENAFFGVVGAAAARQTGGPGLRIP